MIFVECKLFKQFRDLSNLREKQNYFYKNISKLFIIIFWYKLDKII